MMFAFHNRQIKILVLLALTLRWDTGSVFAGNTCPSQAGPFSFPSDEARHTNQTEWWYINGHLTDKDNKNAYDFLVVFFQLPAADNSGGQFVFALTDSKNQKHMVFKKNYEPHTYFLSRGRLWVLFGSGDLENKFSRTSADQCVYALHVVDPTDNTILDLKLTALKPPTPFPSSGHILEKDMAVAYYSQTSISAEGTLILNGVSKPVCGSAWIDRVWGHFDFNHLKWQWFSLQFNDNSELALLRTYSEETGKVLNTYVSYIDSDGKTQFSDKADITAINHWTSPLNGQIYSSGWHIEMPAMLGGVSLFVTPKMKDQEWGRFWEGSCTVKGTINARNVSGEGYAEIMASL